MMIIYEKRCKTNEIQFVNDDAAESIIEKDEYIASLEKVHSDLSDNESDKEEEHFQRNDVIRKFQFDYDCPPRWSMLTTCVSVITRLLAFSQQILIIGVSLLCNAFLPSWPEV